jgi:hypothetical protein
MLGRLRFPLAVFAKAKPDSVPIAAKQSKTVRKGNKKNRVIKDIRDRIALRYYRINCDYWAERRMPNKSFNLSIRPVMVCAGSLCSPRHKPRQSRIAG